MKKIKFFYKKTGMFIDWSQLKKIPDIDIFVDVGFGPFGTADLIEKFKKKKLILIDPLDESENYAKLNLKKKNYNFYKCAVGSYEGILNLNVKKELGNSSFLKETKINFCGNNLYKKKVNIYKLDTIMKFYEKKNEHKKSKSKYIPKIGLKIDTEGYELNVLKGAKETLKKTKFVLLEARHNHISFDGQYRLSELMKFMSNQGFFLEMIVTAKPFIADLCFIRV